VLSKARRAAIQLWLVGIPGLLINSARAEVTRVEITSQKPWLNGRSLGKAGPYERLQGRIYFAIDPESAASRRITDIALAPRDAEGRVEFSSDFVLLRPRDPARARGSVLLEIANRGLTQANGFVFSTAPGSGFDLMNLDATSLRDAFLFEQGFTVAWIGWQLDLARGALKLEAPVANVNSVVRESIIARSDGAHRARLNGSGSYCAADTAQPDARLTVRNRFDEEPRVLPREDWGFEPDPCAIFYRDGFEPGQIYDLIYRGANPGLAGLGEAAVRDFVSFLKHGGRGVQSSIRDHPETLARVLGYGYSQSGRFLRDFLYRGFNADEQGRQAFDGLFIASAGAGRGSFDHRYAMPGEAGNSVLSDLRPVDMFPFTDGIEQDPVTGASDGLLRTAGQSHTLPKIFYTFSSTEYWARAGSLTYTTVDAARELPFSESARLYFFAGTPHSMGGFPPARRTPVSPFSNFQNFASPGWAFRALLLDLDDWTAKGTRPPDSAYPHLGRDLVARDRVAFPQIPGVEFPAWMPGNWRMDYGPDFATKGIISIEPPKLGAAYAILVPQVNRDGVDAGGILLPEVAVPLGTFTGWNYLLPVHPNLDYLAGLVGSFIPFPLTASDRKTSRDSRPSIAERYADREDYLTRMRAAAQSLVARRLLRAEDVSAISAENAARWDFLVGSDK
jgi:Alpha/beta hydrolase domain